MRYAIGEILLVVIGILIALSINNWNEDRKARILEKSFLVRLHKDLVADTTYLVNRLQHTKKFRAQQYEFVHEIYDVQKTEEDFRRVFTLQVLSSKNLIMQTSTYEELKNTGLINIIQNEHLKIEMIDMYREYEIAADHFKEINDFSSREIFSKSARVASKYHHPTLYDEKRLFQGTDWNFINDPSSESFQLLEQTQMAYYIKYGYFIVHLEELLMKSKSVISIIEKDLDI